jgi:hypothetical protein
METDVNGTSRALLSPLLSVSGGASNSWLLERNKKSPAKVARSDEAAADASAHAEWAQRGLSEHASVASFARFSLQLMGFGAPAELLEGSAQAQLDEIRHAKLAFSAATAFGGTQADMRPGAFPAHTVQVGGDMPSVAAALVLEGCVGETLAAFRASVELSKTTHPAAIAALTEVAVDEARHAGLAWRALRWIVQEGGPSVHQASLDALREALRSEPAVPLHGESRALLEARGIITGPALANLRHVAWERAVRPMAIEVLGESAKDLKWLGTEGQYAPAFEEARRLISHEAGMKLAPAGRCAEAIIA